MALSIPTENPQDPKSKPKFDAENLPSQNAHEAMMYSLRQGAVGAVYGLIGSTTFSLLANRYCNTKTFLFIRILILFFSSTCL